MKRATLIGLIGIAAVWISAALTFPLVNSRFGGFQPAELLAVRGTVTALLVLLLFRRNVWRADRGTLAIMFTVALASLGLFQAIRAWGTVPPFIVVAATPLVSFVFARSRGKHVSYATIGAFLLLLTGVTLALWGHPFSPKGFAWSAFGTVMNGLVYESFKKSRADPLKQCFWACVGMAAVGIGGALWLGQLGHLVSGHRLYFSLLLFAFFNGFVYWMGNIFAFGEERLSTEVAAVLAQGETPAILLVAGLFFGQKLALQQWLGVAIAMAGAALLLIWLKKKDEEGPFGYYSRPYPAPP